MDQNVLFKEAEENGLYESRFEHDNCGIGAVVNIKGKKSHETVENALKIVENLEHRAGKDCLLYTSTVRLRNFLKIAG